MKFWNYPLEGWQLGCHRSKVDYIEFWMEPWRRPDGRQVETMGEGEFWFRGREYNIVVPFYPFRYFFLSYKHA
jgi:hypothetical protein